MGMGNMGRMVSRDPRPSLAMGLITTNFCLLIIISGWTTHALVFVAVVAGVELALVMVPII